MSKFSAVRSAVSRALVGPSTVISTSPPRTRSPSLTCVRYAPSRANTASATARPATTPSPDHARPRSRSDRRWLGYVLVASPASPRSSRSAMSIRALTSFFNCFFFFFCGYCTYLFVQLRLCSVDPAFCNTPLADRLDNHIDESIAQRIRTSHGKLPPFGSLTYS